MPPMVRSSSHLRQLQSVSVCFHVRVHTTHLKAQHQRTSMPVSSKQATGTLHRHFNLFPDLFVTSTSNEEATAPFVRIDILHALHVGYCALHCGSANHSRTSSHNSLPDLIGCSSSSYESSDDELPELESIEHTAVECRKCRPFPTSHTCRPHACRFL